jgi:hypothetical protein
MPAAVMARAWQPPNSSDAAAANVTTPIDDHDDNVSRSVTSRMCAPLLAVRDANVPGVRHDVSGGSHKLRAGQEQLRGACDLLWGQRA